MRKKSNFIVQGGILAAAGILSRIIGIARRFPMEHIIGDVGNGYYSAAYEVYAMMLIISCYSLPLAVSKVVSAKIGKRQYRNANRAFQCAMAFAVAAGGLTFLIVEVFGDVLATNFMLEPMSAMALKVLGPALLIVSIMGVFRGYFQAHRTMIPTSLSQIVEQVANAVISIGAAVFFIHAFAGGDADKIPVFGAMGSAAGIGAGVITGLLFMLFIYSCNKKYFKKFKKMIRVLTVPIKISLGLSL